MEAPRRTAVWIIGGLLARVLMIAFLLMSARFILSNRLDGYDVDNSYVKLQSCTYAVASAMVGVAGSLLQIPVSIYLLCKSNRMSPSAIILDISMAADILVSLVLASGVGAGFGASNDILRFIRASEIRWDNPSFREDLTSYYNRGIVAVVFLLAGMLLSICATVSSARLRVKAINDDEGV